MPEFFPVIAAQESSDLVGHLQWRCLVCQLPGYVMPGYLKAFKQGKEAAFDVFCSRCGSYRCSQQATTSSKWSNLSSSQIANISGYLRENQPVTIKNDSDIDFLAGLVTPSVAAKALKLLTGIARKHPIPGTHLELCLSGIDSQMHHFKSVTSGSYPADATADKAALELFPALSLAWAHNEAELRFLVVDYLVKGLGLLAQATQTESPKIGFKISARGWEHIQVSGASEASTGFVAMWFDDSMTPAWENGFYIAIRDAGYSPLRIDKKDHNNKIDDEIIASIRGARFVVADFTGQRGGVYYEAGFAGGLGKPVIWCVRDSDLESLHFDTRQFSHIVWSENDLPSLKQKLQSRIEATIGKGPHSTSPGAGMR